MNADRSATADERRVNLRWIQHRKQFEPRLCRTGIFFSRVITKVFMVEGQ